MLDIWRCIYNILLNSSKTVNVAIGPVKDNSIFHLFVLINNYNPIREFDQFEYPGVACNAHGALAVDAPSILKASFMLHSTRYLSDV
jgi:hypothetical protein